MVDNTAFVKGLQNATEEIIRKEVRRMNKATEHLKSVMVIGIPSDTGYLRASAVAEVKTSSDEIVGIVGNSSFYAPFVHQGTGIYAKGGNGRKSPWWYYVATGKYKGWHKTIGQKPQPFLEEAIDQSKADIAKILGAK